MYAIVIIASVLAVVFLQMLLYNRYAFKNLHYTCRFSKQEVTEGELFFLIEEIENHKILPLPWIKCDLNLFDEIEFVDHILDKHSAPHSILSFFMLGGRKKVHREWRVRVTCRGSIMRPIFPYPPVTC